MPRKKTLSPLEELNALEAEEKVLRERRVALEQAAAGELVEVLRVAGALGLDKDALVGGLLHVVAEVRLNGETAEAWRVAGRRFRKPGREPVGTKERGVASPS